MRPTARLCGIKGIFPLMKKECPQAIYYPHRFDDLSGYRIAVDATLLVQRFHFSDDDHPARHLIGFHRLISSLRASNVFPIFVFDHLTSRITAKSRETEKRREARNRVRARMKMELRRAWRLKVLNQTLQRLESIEGRDKRKVAELLQQWSQKSSPSSDSSSSTWLDDLDKSITAAVPTITDEWASFRLRLDELREEDPSAWAADRELNLAATGPTQPRSSRMDPSISDQTSDVVEEPEDVEQWQTIYEEQTSSAYAIASRIDLLRQDFQRLHSDTQSSSSSKPPHPVTPIQAEMNAVEEQLYNRLASGIDSGSDRLDKSGSLPWSIVERQMDESLRKAQEVAIPQATQAVQETSDAEVIAEEAMEQPSVPSEDVAVPQDTQAVQETRGAEVVGEEAIDAPSAPSPSPVTLDPAELPSAPLPAPVVSDPVEAALDEHRQRQSALETITARNASLQKSYGRSSAPLSPTVFDDAATLCSLLQVPVLWTGSGSPYGGAKGEAEALAASLVNLGQADAVATEDSDVLLAEVPLIRHLTGTKKPLELVDSQLARRCLFPVKMPSAGSTKVKKPAASDELDSTPLSAEEQAKVEETEALDAQSRADKLSRYAMLDFALLCGTDYNRTIPGLAGRGALKLLREHGSIRAMLKALNSPMVTAPVKDASTSGDAKQNSSMSTATPVMSKATPPFTPKYHPPEGLSWKDYGAELSRARAIFNNPPDASRALRLAGIQSSEVEKTADAAPKEGQEGESIDEAVTPAEATLKIAPKPRVSILDYLRSKATATTASAAPTKSSSSIDDHNTRSRHPPQLFTIPDFDRQAVRAFLKSKGLGKGREPVAVEGNIRSWSLESGEMMVHEELADRRDEQQEVKQSNSVGFGRVLGGEISGGATFAFDYQQHQQHGQQRKTV